MNNHNELNKKYTIVDNTKIECTKCSIEKANLCNDCGKPILYE